MFALALAVGGKRTTFLRAFIRHKTTPLQAVHDILLGARYKTALIGIFNTQYKIAAM